MNKILIYLASIVFAVTFLFSGCDLTKKYSGETSLDLLTSILENEEYASIFSLNKINVTYCEAIADDFSESTSAFYPINAYFDKAFSSSLDFLLSTKNAMILSWNDANSTKVYYEIKKFQSELDDFIVKKANLESSLSGYTTTLNAIQQSKLTSFYLAYRDLIQVSIDLNSVYISAYINKYSPNMLEQKDDRIIEEVRMILQIKLNDFICMSYNLDIVNAFDYYEFSMFEKVIFNNSTYLLDYVNRINYEILSLPSSISAEIINSINYLLSYESILNGNIKIFEAAVNDINFSAIKTTNLTLSQYLDTLSTSEMNDINVLENLLKTTFMEYISLLALVYDVL